MPCSDVVYCVCAVSCLFSVYRGSEIGPQMVVGQFRARIHCKTFFNSVLGDTKYLIYAITRLSKQAKWGSF